MSATAAAAHADAPDAAPPPRRVTAARMVRLVMRQPRSVEAVMVGRVPYGAEIVLRAVARAIAASDELGRYRPPPDARVGAVLGLDMRVLTSDAIERDLEALVAAGMVLRDEDGTLGLPLDFAALSAPVAPARALQAGELDHLPPHHRAAILNGAKGGRPRSASSPGRPVPGQRAMPMFGVVHGTGPEGVSPVSRHETQKPGGETQGETQGETRGAGRVSGLGFAAGGTERTNAAAAVSSGFSDQQEDSAAAAALPDARAGENPKPETQTETQTQPGSGFRQNPERNPGGVSEAARRLAEIGIRTFHWSGQNARAAPAIIQRQLEAGYSEAEIHDAMGEHVGREVNGARYFDKALAGRRLRLQATAPPAVGLAAPEARGPANGALALMMRLQREGAVLPELPP